MAIKQLDGNTLFLKKVQMEAFLNIKEENETRSMSKISHEIQMTYPYFVRLMNAFVQKGLIDVVKVDKRSRIPRLTDKGKKVKERIIALQTEIMD